MNSSETWRVIVPKSVQKQIKRFPVNDAERIRLVLRDIGVNPFAGDKERLGGYDNTWRRRIGNYRMIYEIRSGGRVILVNEIKRRTSNTY